MNIFFNWFNSIYNFLFSVWEALLNAPNPFWAGIIFLANGGWIFVVIIMWDAGRTAWREWRWAVYHAKRRKFILLAIDVPRDNEQSPKAVESIFAHLHGVLPSRGTLYQEWWLGKTPDYFSVELVSIEGYVQFLIYTQVEYRDLVESAFYAHYPDAEITEVEDYVNGLNGEFKDLTFPNDKYDILGCEYVLQRSNAYPIRCYTEFEHTLSQEYKDPMASILEMMNKVAPGEQIWLQLVITPEYDEAWMPQANEEAMRIAGKALPEKAGGLMDNLLGGILKWLDALCAVVFPFYNAEAEEVKKDDLPSLMLHLTPTERTQLEGIQKKADKLGFWTKFRFVYIAKKEIFSKARSITPVGGVLRQFSSLNTNSFAAHKYTRTWGLYYLFVKKREAIRKRKILLAFQERARSAGSRGIILNIEELASVYHFPTIYVKAPLVSRTQAKRAGAPISLPLETQMPHDRFHPAPLADRGAPPRELPGGEERAAAAPEPAGVPDNLPFV